MSVKTGPLEVNCARLEKGLMDVVNGNFLKHMQVNAFPRMGCSSDWQGMYETTIKERRMFFYLSGCTALGKPILVEVEIGHDESWVPFVVITSTESEDETHVIVGSDPTLASEQVTRILDDTVIAAKQRVQHERDNLAELTEGQTSIKIYY